MIVWGRRGNVIELGKIGHRYCPVCERDRDFMLTLVYRYVHLFWIPMFSYDATYYCRCDICSRGDKLKSSKVQPYLKGDPRPWLHRFGWIIPAIGFAFLALSGVK